MATFKRATSAVVLLATCFAAATLQGCISCPPIPELTSLPGQDFSTPERAFAYLRDAILRGEESDAYAYHEFRCFSELLKREKKLTREDYFLARSHVLSFFREHIGDPARVRIENVRRLGPDRVELLLSGGGRTARTIVVRENGYEVRFRDRRVVDDVFGEFVAPRDGLTISDTTLELRLAVDDALAARPGLTVDDVYEVRYVSEWKFYSLDDKDLVDEIQRHSEASKKAAAPVVPPEKK